MKVELMILPRRHFCFQGKLCEGFGEGSLQKRQKEQLTKAPKAALKAAPKIIKVQVEGFAKATKASHPSQETKYFDANDEVI